MELGGERIALIESLGDGLASFAQLGVIDGHAHQAARTVLQSAAEYRREELLGTPLAAGMQKILRAPTAILAAVGPDDSRQAAPAQTHQRSQRLTNAPLKSARLRKHVVPVLDDGEKGGEQTHRASGRRAKVFFSGRRKRSPRATFLVSEETKLSRSTATLKWVWMRSRICEICSGPRAFLSMSKAISTCDRPLRRRGPGGSSWGWRRRRTARRCASR